MERSIVQLKYRVHEGNKAGHIFFLCQALLYCVKCVKFQAEKSS